MDKNDSQSSLKLDIKDKFGTPLMADFMDILYVALATIVK